MDAVTTDDATEVLRRHLDPSATCTGVERGPIGNGQETWFLEVTTRAGARPLVLRRTAEAGPLEWTDRQQEAATMSAVADRGLPVPRVHWSTDDTEELGAPYLVMDRAPGTSVMLARGDERVALAADLARQLARLHREAVPDPHGRDATTATRDEIDRWRRHYLDHRVAPVPILDALLAWCDANVPDLAGSPAVQLWGDAGAHNTLGADGRVTALLDWELAHAGHPFEDLAGAIWIELDGDVDTDVLVGAYEEESGVPVDRDAVDFFVAMTCITRSVMIVVGAAAFVHGRTHAPNLAGLGLDLPGVQLARAAELAGWPPAPTPQPPDHAPPVEDVLHPTADEIDRGIARFLRDEVLAQVEDRRTRRGLKTAVALLEVAALRARHEPTVARARRARSSALLRDLAERGIEGDLATAAEQVELDPAHADLRPRVRQHLINDLSDQRDLLVPLRHLYGR